MMESEYTPKRFLEIMEREVQNKNEKNPLLRLVKYPPR